MKNLLLIAVASFIVVTNVWAGAPYAQTIVCGSEYTVNDGDVEFTNANVVLYQNADGKALLFVGVEGSEYDRNMYEVTLETNTEASKVAKTEFTWDNAGTAVKSEITFNFTDAFDDTNVESTMVYKMTVEGEVNSDTQKMKCVFN